MGAEWSGLRLPRAYAVRSDSNSEAQAKTPQSRSSSQPKNAVHAIVMPSTSKISAAEKSYLGGQGIVPCNVASDVFVKTPATRPKFGLDKNVGRHRVLIMQAAVDFYVTQ